jgi:hypothetical protein
MMPSCYTRACIRLPPAQVPRASGATGRHTEDGTRGSQPERTGGGGPSAGLHGVNGLRGATLTVRFLCELAMLAALAFWGFDVGDGVGAWVLGIGAPSLAAVVWGALVAPKARWPVSIPVRAVIELVLFGAAAGALAVAGQPVAAVVLGVAGFATSLLNASQERRAGVDPPCR